MKKFLLSICFMHLVFLGITQTFTVDWDQNYGSSGYDRAIKTIKTADGGLLTLGFIGSSGADVTSFNGGTYDVWVVKTSASGVIQWKRTIGGTDYEIATDVIQTGDGGYVVVGTSSSSDADFSSAGSHGGQDAFIAKLDGSGSISWAKNYGGSQWDGFYSIIESGSDLIVVGGSASSDQDVSTNYGGNDIWLVKTNSAGTLIWEKNYGGSADEIGAGVKEIGGDVIISGNTQSSDIDVSANNGFSDLWTLRVDTSSRAIVWEVSHGGSSGEQSNDMILTAGGNVLIGASSGSIDGDVSGNYGGSDVWIVNLDGSSGNLIWEKNYGSSGGETYYANSDVAVIENSLGNYVFCSTAPVADNDISSVFGNGDIWFVEISSTGTILREHSFGGSNGELAASVIEVTPDEYIIGGTTNSQNFDVSGTHSSSNDFWVFKMSITACLAPTDTGGDADFCSGSSFTFPSRTCSFGTLRWYENSAATGLFHTGTTVNPSGTTVYYPFCYDVSCLSTVGDSVIATEVVTPSMPTSLSATINNDCPGYSTVISATCAIGSVRWYVSPTDTGIGIGNSHIINLNTSFFARCFDSLALEECSYGPADKIDLTVLGPTPTASISKSTPSPCRNFSQCFSTPNIPGATYQWYVIPSTPISNDSTSFTCIPFSTTGTKTVYVEVTFNGCMAIDSFTFDMVDTLVANVTQTSSTSCEEANICFFSNNFEVGTQYSWTTTGSPIVDTTDNRNPCFNWNTPGTYQIYMHAYTSFCNTYDTFNITVDTVPISQISITSADTCVGFNTCFSTPDVIGANYTWTASGSVGGTSNLRTPCFSWTSAGVKSIYLEVERDGCKSFDTIFITIVDVPPVPTSLLATPNNGCANLNVTLAGSCSEGILNWYTTANGTGTSIGSSQVVSATTTFYARCYNSSKPNGCDYSIADSVIVTIDDPGAPDPISTLPTTPIVCSGDTIEFYSSCSTGSLKWFSNPQGSGSPITTGSPYVFYATTPGNYTVYAFCESTGGCLGTVMDSVQYTVNSIPFNPSSPTATPSSICSGDSSLLTASGCATGIILWYDNAAGTGTPIDTTTAYVKPTVSQNYYAYCDVYGSCRSSFGSSVMVSVSNQPTSPTSISATPDTGCAPLSTTLNGTCATGVLRWYATPGGTGSGIGNSPTVSSTSTFYGKCYMSGNPSTCQYSPAVSVTINVTAAPSNPISVVTDRDTICPTESATLTASGCTTFEWYTNPSASGSPIAINTGTLVVSPLSTTTYYAFCSSNGCLSTGYRSVKVTVDTCFTTGIYGSVDDVNALIYPNPFTDVISLEIAKSNNHIYSIEIVNIQGMLIQTIPNIASGKTILELSVENGIYLFNLKDNQGIIRKSIRVTKQ